MGWVAFERVVGLQPAAAIAPAAVPSVMGNCLPDPLGSMGAAVFLAVVLMSLVALLAWVMAAIPEATSRALPLAVSSHVTAASSLLQSAGATRRARRMDVLDGLRTVLVMYIVIYHVRWALPPMLAPFFSQGHWAVQFFFVLSGFVASCYASEQRIDADSARKMTVRRITRLCPPYFVALLGVAAVTASRGGGQPFLAWPIQALFLQSLMPLKICGPIDVGHWSKNFLPFSANGEGWFVSAILITSLCFPLLHNARPRGGFKATLLALSLVVVGRSLPTFLTMAGWCPFDTYTFAPVRLLEFTAGMLSAQLYKEMPAAAVEFGGWDWVFDASLLAAALPIWFLHHWQSWLACEFNHGDFFLTAVFCLTCIAARGLAEQQALALDDNKAQALDMGSPFVFSSPLSGLLSSWVLVMPAVYSYQAYVYQEIFIAILAVQPHATILRYWWLPVPLTWAAAVMSLHLVEEPLKRVVEARLATARCTSLSK